MTEVDWDDLSKKERRKLVEKALKRHDVDTLVSLTAHNLMLYGRGGSDTSPHTLRGYRTGVRYFLAYAFARGWERLTEHDTDLTVGYLRDLRRQGLAPGTVNARRSAAKALYRALRWAGVTTADPVADTPRAQEVTERWEKREAYTREDLAALLAVADPWEELFLLLGAHAGLRISELIGLTWDRVDLASRTMTVTGKGRKTASIHLSAALHQALLRVPEEARHGHVLPWRNPKTLRLVLRSLCLQAGVDYSRRQVHGLRHACATLLLEDTRDLYLVARHLRHSSTSTTEVYSKVSSQRIASALEGWTGEARVTN
ncbi:tyrosine-type recombinase/integrase [Deinococcus sp. DB0503]|uniref:tyrosine-type recombinase/integrase n=1 Tax=Deinococcus sp. DB0503 TaxID=2479203 RepID=UPI0018DFE650|nr:tyrosine-type recombinase/integrase [Deinococcus sp. DB0503]MBI0447141.1 recombinase XerC [Deinococcus sp. DB0503]